MNTKDTGEMPIEFQYGTNGYMNCMHSLFSIDLSLFTDFYFVIYSHHQGLYKIAEQIKVQWQIFNNDYVPNCLHFVFLENITSSQAETIALTIEKEHITGPIFIKDADNACVAKPKLDNTVLIYPLEECDIVVPQHKSYVTIDDNMYVTNIIENKIVSNYFNCGGYSFKDANDYVKAYNVVSHYEYHICISHIIYYLMLYHNMIFKPIEATEYTDFELDF